MLLPFHFSENTGFLSWRLEPTATISILVVGFLYFRWIRHYQEQNPDAEVISRRQQTYFVIGLLAFVVALLSPIDAWASYLLTMHMVQHVLLTIVGPPLLLMGLPRPMVQRLALTGRVWTAWRFLTRPLHAFIIFNAVFTFIHLPVLYNLILRSEPVHITAHLLLMGTAVIGWWPVLAPGREFGEMTPALKMVYLLVNTIPGQIVGAVITLTNPPIYYEYTLAPFRLWGMSLQVDQELGGLLMWVGVGSFYLFVAGMAFFRWAAAADDRERVRITPSPR